MAELQYLSTDPSAATLLQAPPSGNPTMHAPTGNEPVTLGDLKEDPVGSLQRIGSLLKKDATDPKLWIGLAVSYFGPKALGMIAPTVAKAAASVSRGAAAIEPGDVIGMIPRPRSVDAAIKVAQKVGTAMRTPAEAAPTAPPETVAASPAPAAGPPPESVPATAPTNAYPDQKALNQEAMARRQAAYQARQAAEGDAKLYTKLRTQNLTDAEARQVMAAKTAMEQLRGGGGTMTDAEVAAEIAARKGNRSPKR